MGVDRFKLRTLKNIFNKQKAIYKILHRSVCNRTPPAPHHEAHLCGVFSAPCLHGIHRPRSAPEGPRPRQGPTFKGPHQGEAEETRVPCGMGGCDDSSLRDTQGTGSCCKFDIHLCLA